MSNFILLQPFPCLLLFVKSRRCVPVNRDRFPVLLRKSAGGSRTDQVLRKQNGDPGSGGYRRQQEKDSLKVPEQESSPVWVIGAPDVPGVLRHPLPLRHPVLPGQNGNRTWYSEIPLCAGWKNRPWRNCDRKNCGKLFSFSAFRKCGKLCCGKAFWICGAVFGSGGSFPPLRPLPHSRGLSRV